MSVFEKAVKQLADEFEFRGCKTKMVGNELYLIDGDEIRKVDVQPKQVTCIRVVPDEYGIQMMALDTLIEIEKRKS